MYNTIQLYNDLSYLIPNDRVKTISKKRYIEHYQ